MPLFARYDGLKVVAQQAKELIQGGSVAHGYVVDLVERRWGGCTRLPGFARYDATCSRCGQQVGLHGVGHKAKVAAGFAIAIDVDGLAFDQRIGPFGDDGGIGAVRVLAWPKHIEVPQPNGLKAITACKHIGIQLVDVFGHGVRAERVADVFFHLGQRRVVTIGAAAGGVGEALHFGVTCSDQHVEEAGDVGCVGGDGVGQATGYAA